LNTVVLSAGYCSHTYTEKRHFRPYRPCGYRVCSCRLLWKSFFVAILRYRFRDPLLQTGSIWERNDPFQRFDINHGLCRH